MKVYFIIEDEASDASTMLKDCKDAETFADKMNSCVGVTFYAVVVDALRIATNKVLAQRNPKAKAYVYVDDELGCIEVCKTRFLRRIRYILH